MAAKRARQLEAVEKGPDPLARAAAQALLKERIERRKVAEPPGAVSLRRAADAVRRFQATHAPLAASALASLIVAAREHDQRAKTDAALDLASAVKDAAADLRDAVRRPAW